MGLTIHYSLTTDLCDRKDVHRLVEAMQHFARDLPFKEVGEIKEFNGKNADYQNDAQDSDRWLKVQAGAYVERDEGHYSVTPSHILAFRTWPGEGCEAANFGFCKYPAFIHRQAPGGRRRRLATNLSGWRWGSFCKTQYASDPSCGGVENFLRCHLCVVHLLDFVKKSGLATVEVSDEGGYWPGRNLEALVKEVGDWNGFLAGATNLIRSQTPGLLFEAPIIGFPDFEHLEAKGLARLKELHRQMKKPAAEE